MDYIGVIAVIMFMPILLVAVVFDNASASGYNAVMTVCILTFVIGGAVGLLCLKAR